MILKGNRRGGSKDLALHLMNPDNEHVELHELRGFVSDTLMGALNEIYAISKGTRCKKFMYSMSVNPPPGKKASTDDILAAIEDSEKTLKLTGQPRAIVFHVKAGSDGIARRHAHVVWSLIDTQHMKAVRLRNDRRKLQPLTRELFVRHGWDMPPGLLDKKDRDRHGKVRIRYRNKAAGEKGVYLRGPIDSPEFWEDYHAAAGNTTKAPKKGVPVQRTMRWLINQYYHSAGFRQLGKRTQYVRKGLLEGFCEEHGEKRFAQLEPRHLRRIRDSKVQTPDQMNNILKALRQVFKYAVDEDHVRHNPVLEVDYLRSHKGGGHHTWTLEEITLFEEHHPTGTKARLALDLMLYLSVRRGDVVRLGRQHERNGWIHYTQEKTGKDMEVPILSTLRESIDATPGDLTYLVTQFGKPFTANGFGNWFKKRCVEAGLPGHCSAHWLRKASATALADKGCTAHEIMAITGHDSLKEVERYTKKAEQRHLAASAMAKLENKK